VNLFSLLIDVLGRSPRSATHPFLLLSVEGSLRTQCFYTHLNLLSMKNRRLPKPDAFTNLRFRRLLKSFAYAHKDNAAMPKGSFGAIQPQTDVLIFSQKGGCNG
jgi:hypothetical protein